ncbi:MAG: hypothetical protein ABIJ41_05805 [Candidatus Omnitrophota bacterium]
MSIIYEALKKTQSQLEKKLKVHHSVKKGERNTVVWVATILVFIGFVGCAGALLYIILLKPSLEMVSVQKQTETVPSREIIPTSRQDSARGSRPSRNDLPASDLTLNGIIAMEGDYFALINNEILREGEYIEGKRIAKISVDKVEIEDNGQLIILKTPR